MYLEVKCTCTRILPSFFKFSLLRIIVPSNFHLDVTGRQRNFALTNFRYCKISFPSKKYWRIFVSKGIQSLRNFDGNFDKISREQRTKFDEFRLHYFCTILYSFPLVQAVGCHIFIFFSVSLLFLTLLNLVKHQAMRPSIKYWGWDRAIGVAANNFIWLYSFVLHIKGGS